jgi:hypothetical protein
MGRWGNNMMDFMQKLFGSPANDPKMPQGQLTAENLPALMAYLKQPTANDRLMAASKALSAIGNARAQGGDFGMALGAGGQAMSDTIGAANEQRTGELQSQMTLRDLFKPKKPTRRDSFGTNAKGESVKFQEDVDDEGTVTRVAGSEIPYYQPKQTGMNEYQEALIALRNADKGDNGMADIQKQIAQMKLDRLEADAKAPPIVKPLSSSLQKLQDDRLQEISDLYNRATPLSESMSDIQNKKLDLGVFQNAINTGLGAVNMGGEEATKLTNLKTALLGLAVDQSNMAKGVPTDKDFENARKSILDNINNAAYVEENLPKLIALNNKRRQDRQNMINTMRRQQGQPEMTAQEFSAYGGDNVIPVNEGAPKPATGFVIREKGK